ncbi:MAG: hypothetical protein LLF28_02515 [Nitrospiraceae bacterium]|nr:hypothetical protein [Nitrospiraceae bacterium]
MSLSSIRGKSLKAVALDIADSYITVNPLFLKPLDEESLTGIYHEIIQVQVLIRSEKIPVNDIQSIRMRNVRLQRLQSAIMIIKNFARERRILLV